MSWDLPRDLDRLRSLSSLSPPSRPLSPPFAPSHPLSSPLTLILPSSATQVFDFQMAAAVLRYNQAAPFREAIPVADEWSTLEWTNDNSIRTRAVRIVPRWRQWFRKNAFEEDHFGFWWGLSLTKNSISCIAITKWIWNNCLYLFLQYKSRA